MKWPARVLGLGVGGLAILGICAASINNIRSCARDTAPVPERSSTWQPPTRMDTAQSTQAAEPVPLPDAPPRHPSGGLQLYHIHGVGPSDGGPMIIGSDASNAAPVYVDESILNGVHAGNVIQNGPVQNNNSIIRGGDIIITPDAGLH